jgi:hypothetical protein
MLELAKECAHLAIYTHVSTCYVNCEKFGFIKEQIYDIPEDSEEIVNHLMKLSVEEQERDLKKILGLWPNTYTFTKSMAERTLKKRRPLNLPVAIVRPAIISGAIREPIPGWTDTLSAAGALSSIGATGLLKYVHGDVNNVTDIIPVDYVSNTILVTTALNAFKPGLTVVHANSSHKNPVTWGEYLQAGWENLKVQPIPYQVYQPDVQFINNKRTLKRLFYLRSILPTNILSKVAQIPGIGSAKMRADLKQLREVNTKIGEMYDIFAHFTCNEWIYETGKVYEMLAQMIPEEQKIFYIDPKTFTWQEGVDYYSYGVQKYMWKADVIFPDGKQTLMLHKNHFRYFDDMQRAFMEFQIITKDTVRIRKDALTSAALYRYIEAALKKEPALGQAAPSKDALMAQAERHIDEIEAHISPVFIKSTMYFLLKVWEKLFKNILVYQEGLDVIKTIL